VSETRLRKECLATDDNFVESAYLDANPDVAAAVASGHFPSGRRHFEIFGHKEGRLLRFEYSPVPVEAKQRKLERIRPLLRTDLPFVESDEGFDFLTDELRARFNIVDTSAVSSNEYDRNVLGLIEKHTEGLILDCGAGKRNRYYDNVVNFEIVPYDTTDVRGVGEVLPFRDASFDAVISVAVLEHVKDPFRCARELMRVLKPGGDLYCCVPFLQPYHGYPHHYYNMTHQGLTNLFDGELDSPLVEVPDSVLPIWSLSWILSSWAGGLPMEVKDGFLDMRVRDLIDAPVNYLQEGFVRMLPKEKNLELASACILSGRKKVET
jgi:SAM-dependent methyltransferase